MWDFAIGVIIGIYLGTYYDFRPGLEILMKWGTGRLPPTRPPPTDSVPAPAPRSLFSFLPTSSEEE